MLELEGLRIRMRQGATVLNYVELYLTDQIIENIVTETNIYADCFFDKCQRKT